MTERPGNTEYDPFYSTYIDKVPAGNVVDLLGDGLEATLELLGQVDPERETYRYADGKWSLREVVGHMIDTERLFGFRALNFARQEGFVLPGMDQLVWAEASNAHQRPLSELSSEFEHLRRSHIAMFGSFDAETMNRTGEASDCPFTVRSLAYMIAGHEIHHRGVLVERYLAD